MNMNVLGGTGLSVSCVGYGTNMLGRRPEPERPGEDACTTDDYYVGMVHAALAEGVSLIDTANCYQDGRSEELLGRALEGRHEGVLVATKCGARSRDFSAAAVRVEAEESLRRLRTDRIDLLQLHNPSLDDLKEADWADGFESLKGTGTIRLGGVSIGSVEQGLWLIGNGLGDALQVNFNIFRPEARERLLPAAAEAGVAVLVKIPLARGLLSGKYGSDSSFPEGDWHRHGIVGDEREMLGRVDRLRELAAEHGMTLAQLALRWVISHPGVSAAIPGAKRVEHVRDTAAAGRAGPLPPDLYGMVEELAGRGGAALP
jgi:aryl-alcohol dehydrogenase-like predicted oxidoreductase